MPVGATMIATDVASPFFTPIKLTFMVSVILSVPIILYGMGLRRAGVV